MKTWLRNHIKRSIGISLLMLVVILWGGILLFQSFMAEKPVDEAFMKTIPVISPIKEPIYEINGRSNLLVYTSGRAPFFVKARTKAFFLMNGWISCKQHIRIADISYMRGPYLCEISIASEMNKGETQVIIGINKYSIETFR